MKNFSKKLWIGIFILIILSPVGLILPYVFNAGSAWGEHGADEISEIAGYTPEKLIKLSELWKAPLPDYSFAGWENKGIVHQSIAYIFSAFIGVLFTTGVILLFGKFLIKKE